jgi:hypothetical protein
MADGFGRRLRTIGVKTRVVSATDLRAGDPHRLNFINVNTPEVEQTARGVGEPDP